MLHQIMLRSCIFLKSLYPMLVYSFFRLSNSKSSGFYTFSGEFMPPPATLTMVAGGGGRVCDIIGLLGRVPILEIER